MIIFMGVAGAGKSIQGKLLAEKLNCSWVSTGELLRKGLKGDRREEMMQGKLLEDEDIIKVINEFFAQSSLDDCVLDGFPRTIKQAQWLMAQHNTGTLNIKAVVHLTASKNIVKKRLLARGRPDDTEYAIDVRFNEYETHTLPIVDWFKKEKITLHEVDGERSIEQIHQDIIKRLSVLDAVSD